MKNKVLTRIGLIPAALGVLTSLSFAQTPPRSGDVFSVWSSLNRALSSRYDFASDPANEVMPDRNHVVTESAIPSSKNNILIDEPQGETSYRFCFRVAAPRNSQQFHNDC